MLCACTDAVSRLMSTGRLQVCQVCRARYKIPGSNGVVADVTNLACMLPYLYTVGEMPYAVDEGYATDARLTRAHLTCRIFDVMATTGRFDSALTLWYAYGRLGVTARERSSQYGGVSAMVGYAFAKPRTRATWLLGYQGVVGNSLASRYGDRLLSDATTTYHSIALQQPARSHDRGRIAMDTLTDQASRIAQTFQSDWVSTRVRNIGKAVQPASPSIPIL